VNRSTGAVTTSLTLITIPGTSEGTRPVTLIMTVDAELPAADAAGASRKPGAADRAKATATCAPRPGGCCAVLAASAPCLAAANAVSLAMYQTAAWTITMRLSRKTGMTIT